MRVDTVLSSIMNRVDELLDDEAIDSGKHYSEVTSELFMLAALDSREFYEPLKTAGGDTDFLSELLKKALKVATRTEGSTSMSQEVGVAIEVATTVARTRGFPGVYFVDTMYVLLMQCEDVRYYIERCGADVKSFVEELYKIAGLSAPVLRRVSNGVMLGVDGRKSGDFGGLTMADVATSPSCIEMFTVDMLKLAESTKEPLVGRESELDKTIRILCRKSKANPLHVGEPGVGKTTIVLGLAKRILAGSVPEKLKGYEIYSLDTNALMAGTRYRGDTEERVQGLIKELSAKEKVILYIDEIHNLVGTGTAGGSGLDLGGLFKTALTESGIRFIGTTTYDEYRQYIEKDKALSRRFKCVDILEPSQAEAKEVIRGILPYYSEYHGVEYAPEAVDAAVELTAKYVTEKYLPDKAIDVIDEAGAMFSKDNNNGVVDAKVIEKLVAESCRIPIETVEVSDSQKLLTLADAIKKRVFGQNEAIDECVQAIKLARSGLQDADKPMASLLFVGQTGVGKTEIAKQLASHMGIDLVRFDMSEYSDSTSVNKLIGSNSGYVGYEEGGLLVEEIRKHPHSVLLLDEIEKAHPNVFNTLLQVMDNAQLTDNKGRKADFRNVILIMTSNAGASGVVSRGLGFGVATKVIDMGNMRRAVEKTFTPEFRNRLTKVIVLNSMDDQMAANIVSIRMKDLTSLMKSKGVKLTYGSKVLDYIKSKGITEEFGARELLRVINSDIKLLFVDDMLVGRIHDGSVVRLSIKDEKPVIVIE